MIKTKIKCQLCGQEISASNYSKHIKRHQNHPETFNEPKYRLNHDGLVCQFCGKECKNRNSLCNHERLCKENPDKQQSNLINSSGSGWNKGLTKETDERVLKGALTYKKHLKEGKICTLKGNMNPSCRPEVREKISRTCLQKSKEGTWHTSLAKKHHYNYNGIDLHGKWEYEFVKYLDSNNIKWERCKERFPYLFENKTHYYTPDFYLLDYGFYIEIKGFRTQKDIEKWNQFPEDKILKVVYGKDLLKLGLCISL